MQSRIFSIPTFMLWYCKFLAYSLIWGRRELGKYSFENINNHVNYKNNIQRCHTLHVHVLL